MYERSKTTRITWNKRVLTKTMGVNLVRKYMGSEKANHMREFREEHELL